MHPDLLKLTSSLIVFCLIGCRDKEDPCLSSSADFSYSESIGGKPASCPWFESERSSTVVPNPKPEFSSTSQAGIFSAMPAGIVFVDNKTGEIDLKASLAGSYTITNTLDCSLSASSEFTIFPAEQLTVEEVVTDLSGDEPHPHYYHFQGTESHPEFTDGSKYFYSWHRVSATGAITDVQGVPNLWESKASADMSYFIAPDPATGKSRNDEALVVDVISLSTGCVTRLHFGKPLSEFPEPGRSL